VLGVALLPVIGAAFVIDARRRPLGREAVASIVVLAIAYLPLVANELTTGFSEVRAALDYLAGGRTPSETSIPVRFGIVGLRVVSWPLVGLITDGFVPAVLATCAVIAIVLWRWRDSWVARWLGLGLLWSTAFLTVAAPSLAAVVEGLPNDHYHAFADPMVFVLIGLGGAALAGAAFGGGGGGGEAGAGAGAGAGGSSASGASASGARRWIGPGLAAALVLVLAAWNVTHLPPSTHPDGGYPAGLAAGERVDAALTQAGAGAEATVLLQSLPDFKSTEAVAYPLAVLGRSFVAETPRGVAPGSADVAAVSQFAGLVLLCDDLFADAIGAACGGPAEATVTPDAGGGSWGPLLERFEAAPGRWVSVYGEGS
jgi:hypothetical protein